jgi:hypothetical protein
MVLSKFQTFEPSKTLWVAAWGSEKSVTSNHQFLPKMLCPAYLLQQTKPMGWRIEWLEVLQDEYGSLRRNVRNLFTFR